MLKFLLNCKEIFILLAQVNIKRQSKVFLIELPQITLTINPSLFLINSSLQQALQIEELKTLYGYNWPDIYKEILAKQRLETSFSKGFTKELNTNNNKELDTNTKELNTNTKPCNTNRKCTCKEVSDNVCS